MRLLGCLCILNCYFDTELYIALFEEVLEDEGTSAQLIACTRFCKAFDVCVAILPCDCRDTLNGAASIWFIDVVL